MKKMLGRSLSVLLVISLLLALFSGCGSANEPDTTTASPDLEAPVEVAGETSTEEDYIPMVALGFGHQFWQAVKSGAEEAAKDYGVKITFEGPETETMVDKQVDMIRTALGKNPVAICVAAIDNESVKADLTDAKEKGIKIVGFDAGCGDLADTHCSTSSFSAGALAAENAIRLAGTEGKIAVIGHSQTTVDAVARVEGFVEYIKENSNLDIVDIQYGEGDHMISADLAKSMMVANPDIKLIYTSNEGACVGAYNGLKEVGKIDDVMLIGFDSSAAMKEAIRNGEIVGAITQDPVGMGYKSVEAAVKLVRGEEVDPIIDTGCYWYDVSNMDDDHIAPLLYD